MEKNMNENKESEEFVTWEELKAEMDADSKKKNIRNWLGNKFPKGIASYHTYHALTHPWLIVEYWANTVKYAWQRVFRGWDDRAWWSIPNYHSKLISELVRELKNHNNYGVPCVIIDKYPYDEDHQHSDEDYEKAKKDWHDILDQIADGFSQYEEGSTQDEMEISEKKFNKAFDLFREYYGNLWD